MITKINNPVLDLTNPSISNGALFSNTVNMGGNPIENIPLLPSNNDDAASKFYVDQVASTAGGGVFLPAGLGPIPWGANTVVPAGWILCDGQEYDPAIEAQLFAAIGTTYNTGGETPGWFRVPDMRGIAPAGMDNMAPFGSTTGPGGNILDPAADTQGGLHPLGAEDHTLVIGEIPGHNHPGSSIDPVSDHTHGGVPLTYDGNQGGGGSNAARNAGGNTGPAGGHTHTFTIALEGGGGAHNNMQPTRFFAWIMKRDDSVLGFPGDINMSGNFIIDMADPVNPQDAATKAYVDARASYDVSAYRSGVQFSAGKEIARVPVVRNFSIPANFVGSRCEGRLNSTGVSTFTIWKNGTQIGTITVGGGSATGAFADTVAGPHTFTTTDQLLVVEATADATYEDVGIVIEALLT